MRGILAVIVALLLAGCSGGRPSPDAALMTDGWPAAVAPPVDARPGAEPEAGARALDVGHAVARPVRPVLPVPTPVGPALIPSAEPSALPPAQAGRPAIYTAEIGILVRNLDESVRAMSDMATSLGGYVAGVKHTEENGRPVATVRLEVPADRYDRAMRQLRGLAVEVTDEKASSRDVTDELGDVETQLAAIEADRAQLQELLGRATDVDEVLDIRARLAQATSRIDRLKGRQAFLRRNAELATIAVRARAADDVLTRMYTSLRTALQRAETQRAATLAALGRPRTPVEEAQVRDRLAETTVEIDRVTARLQDIEGKARVIGLTLPVAVDPEPAPPQDEAALQAEYLGLRVEIRRVQYEVDRIMRELQRRGDPDDAQLRQQLRAALLERDRLEVRAGLIRERARQAGVTLPSPTAEQESVLAGVPPEGGSDVGRAARAAWEASLRLLETVAVAVVSTVVFLWWVLPFLAVAAYLARRRRRPHAAPPATP
ncbi:MAG: DUF4349 domain-containing protein [Chloroflexota bacterium]|nr:DUF4349 domain-containing protein [Chloroflexota bacterium]